jgi:hypothetical protein
MAANTNIMRLKRFQIQEGDRATAFVRRSYQEELNLVQRYYEKSYNIAVAPGTITAVGEILYSHSSENNWHTTRFTTRKMVTPTVHYYSPATGTIDIVRDDSITTDFAPAQSGNGEASGAHYVTTGGADSHQMSFHFVALAEL